MKKENKFSQEEVISIQKILDSINENNFIKSLSLLEKLKDEIYLSIPEKQRIGKGITWVLNKIACLIIEYNKDLNLKDISLQLYKNNISNKMLSGVPVFLMSEYGLAKPDEVFNFFLEAACHDDWVIKEFTAIGFRQIITANKESCGKFLYSCSTNNNPDIRRFSSETLRPVVECRWIHNNPDYSLIILENMFKEKNEFPRTSVGNNLSDLSKKNPELIFDIIKTLINNNDKNSYWIAYRASRNLIKKYPEKVLNLLKINEYHYKDRNYFRDNQ